MADRSAILTIVFSSLGHAYTHMFTAFYFVIVLALEEDWSIAYHELIELWTLGALLVGVCALPAGWIADRWSARGMMVVFFIGLGGAGILCAMVSRPLAMMIGLSSIGIFAAIYHPVGIPWLVRNTPRRGLALGINGVFGPIGIAAAGLVAGALIDGYGWRAAFFLPGVVSICTGVALWVCSALGLLGDGTQRLQSAAPPSRGDMIRAFAMLLVTMVVMGLVFQSVQVAIPKLFDLRIRDIVGEGALGIGAMVAAVYVLGGTVQVLGGYLADKVSLKPIYFLGFLLQVPVLAMVAVAGGFPLLVLAVLMVVLTSATLPAENLLLARYTPARHHSLAFGVKFVLAFGTAPLAIQAVSIVQEKTGEFEWLFVGLAVIAACAALAAALLPREIGTGPARLGLVSEPRGRTPI
jgi:MFS family permease